MTARDESRPILGMRKANEQEIARFENRGVDSDDASELPQDFFCHAEWRVGERSVSPAVGIAAMAKAALRGNPPLEHTQRFVTVRKDLEVI